MKLTTYLFSTSNSFISKDELSSLGYTDFFTIEEQGAILIGALHSNPAPPQPQTATLTKIIHPQDILSEQWALFGDSFDGTYAHYDLQKYSHPTSLTFRLSCGHGFGDGHHETTTLMLQALTANLPSEPVLIDLGSGSGILTIAALKLDPSRTLYALEIDPPSLAHTRENLTLNNLNARTELQPLTTPSAILVNMLPHEQTLALPQTLALAPHTTTILASGILSSDTPNYINWLQTLGFHLSTQTTLGQWSCLRFYKNFLQQ